MHKNDDVNIDFTGVDGGDKLDKFNSDLSFVEKSKGLTCFSPENGDDQTINVD